MNIITQINLSGSDTTIRSKNLSLSFSKHLKDGTGTIEFNKNLTPADVTRINNSKIIEIVHSEELQNLTILEYRALPFFNFTRLELVLNEFITYKSNNPH